MILIIICNSFWANDECSYFAYIEKEADKVALADSTGLDQKQINNWFINQRKRHWKPSENMQFDAMENLYGTLFTNKGGIS